MAESKATGKVWQIYGSSVVIADQLGPGDMYAPMWEFPDSEAIKVRVGFAPRDLACSPVPRRLFAWCSDTTLAPLLHRDSSTSLFHRMAGFTSVPSMPWDW